MLTKAIARALVAILTVGMTSLLVQPTSALIQADSLTLSTATYSQAIGETATANSPVVTMSYLGQFLGDTYSVSSWLISAPAGNTRIPTLRLIETNSALVYNIAGDGPLALGTNFAAGTSAYVSPSVDGYVAVTARFQVYLDAPTTAGTYVVRLVPTNKSNGGVTNAASLTLTITVGGSSQTQDSTPVYSPPTETSTPDTYTAILNVTTALPTQLTSKNQTTADLFVDFISYATTIGDTSSVTAYLVSAPAGNTSLPVLELTQVTNSRIDKNAKFTEALSPGYKFIGGNSAYMTAPPFLGAMAAKFKLYLDNPKKSGTYVVKLQLRTDSGVATAPTKGLIITFTVTRDPETYPVAADVIISHPGDISNKSDAEINVSKGADTTNEVAVIRTTLRSATGAIATLDSYTAVITGTGLIASAPLSTNINTVGDSRAIYVRAGDVVAVYDMEILVLELLQSITMTEKFWRQKLLLS